MAKSLARRNPKRLGSEHVYYILEISSWTWSLPFGVASTPALLPPPFFDREPELPSWSRSVTVSAKPLVNLSEDHHIASLLPALARRSMDLAEQIFLRAATPVVFSHHEREAAKVLFKPYFGVSRVQGQRRCVPDLAIFIASWVVILEFKLFSKQSYARVLRQLDVHKQAVEKDWPVQIRTSKVLSCLVGPAEKLPAGAVATFVDKGVAYLSWRELAALVLDPDADKAVEADLHRALDRWAKMTNAKKAAA